jgi:hypothetical protein
MLRPNIRGRPTFSSINFLGRQPIITESDELSRGNIGTCMGEKLLIGILSRSLPIGNITHNSLHGYAPYRADSISSVSIKRGPSISVRKRL